jgi:hypothetical protein
MGRLDYPMYHLSDCPGEEFLERLRFREIESREFAAEGVQVEALRD